MKSEISVLPLMHYPNAEAERWFKISPQNPDDKWKMGSMILLSISFQPKVSAPPAVASSTLGTNTHSLATVSKSQEVTKSAPTDKNLIREHHFRLHVSFD